MFSKVAILSGLLAIALSAPAEQKIEQVAIVGQKSDIQPDGSFQWNFESADGTKQEQSGSVKAGAKEDDAVVSIHGSASWTDPEGNKHEIHYVADESGFHPESADIPVVPEVPAQIARALEWIVAHPQPEEKNVKEAYEQ